MWTTDVDDRCGRQMRDATGDRCGRQMRATDAGDRCGRQMRATDAGDRCGRPMRATDAGDRCGRPIGCMNLLIVVPGGFPYSFLLFHYFNTYIPISFFL